LYKYAQGNDAYLKEYKMAYVIQISDHQRKCIIACIKNSPTIIKQFLHTAPSQEEEMNIEFLEGCLTELEADKSVVQDLCR
jgi:hypothetical protein